MGNTRNLPAYEDLVQGDRVHSAVYTDDRIFADELTRIFTNWWVYVGHDSEVPEAGDYKLSTIGAQSVIMSRDRDGEVHLLMNRCRHRGSVVCHYEKGNANIFRCPYHGWTYRNDGRLVGVPYPKAYGTDFDKTRLGLVKVPRIGNYRGFVFASLNPNVDAFEDYLGPAMPYIDWFVDASPSGRIDLSAGVARTQYHGNWKFVGMDGYHPPFAHKSLQDVVRLTAQKKADALFDHYTEDSPLRAVDLGNGHSRLDEQQTEEETILGGLRAAEDAPTREYHRRLEDAYGPGSASRVISRSDPHLAVFPNLQLLGAHVRVIRPMAANLTRLEAYPALLADVPDEINSARLRALEWFHGPASFGSPDDSEIFERMQLGLGAEVNPWVLLSRGLAREDVDDDGRRYANITDETPQRGQLRQWLRVMTAPVDAATELVSEPS